MVCTVECDHFVATWTVEVTLCFNAVDHQTLFTFADVYIMHFVSADFPQDSPKLCKKQHIFRLTKNSTFAVNLVRIIGTYLIDEEVKRGAM